MNTRSNIITTLLLLGTLMCYGQVVASINSPANITNPSMIGISQVSYNVVDASENATFETIDYSATQQKLSLNTEQMVQFITIVKDGEVFLNNMPVLSNNLNLSVKNYESGDYELHMTVEGKKNPTIINLTKS